MSRASQEFFRHITDTCGLEILHLLQTRCCYVRSTRVRHASDITHVTICVRMVYVRDVFVLRKENLYPKTDMYTGCTSDLCETPEIHVSILIRINTIWVRRPMFMSTACLWLLTLQDVHNSVLKVCSLAFFEQFPGMLRNMKDPGNGKQTGNEWNRTRVCSARSLFGTCSPTTNSPGVPTRRRRENLGRVTKPELGCSAVESFGKSTYLRHHSPAGAKIFRSSPQLNFDLKLFKLVCFTSWFYFVAQIHLFSMADPLGRRSESISLNCRHNVHRFVEVVTLNDSTVEQPLNGTEKVWKRRHCLLQGQSRSKWLTTVLEFFVRDVHETLQSDRAPPKAIAWDYTRQSIKLGVNQANTVVHIHKTRKTDEGNSTCGALFPAVTISFGIQLARSLSLSLSLSLCVVFVANVLWTSLNNVICGGVI